MRVIPLEEMQERMLKYHSEDINLYSVGHTNLDQYWKFMLGNVTDITGYPYMGKTLFLMEILYNLSEKHGTKHLLHLPDSGKPEEVMAILIQKSTGKTFDKRYDNVIEGKEIEPAVFWIHQYFKVFDYKEEGLKQGKLIRPTPKEYWDYATSLDVHTASIDSWNYMRHEGSGHEYLADVLSYRNELAERSKMHFFTIIHPKNTDATCYTASGSLKAPDAYRIMGGSEWNNNGKNIISIHKEDKESMDYDIYFQKTKPRIVGKTGFEQLHYDLKLQKFYTIKFNSRMYACGKSEEIEVIQPTGGMGNKFEDHEKRIEPEQITDPENSDLPF